MIALVEERRAQVGIGPLCDALGLARATFYRRRGGPSLTAGDRRERRAPRQALTGPERAAVLTLLHEESRALDGHLGARKRTGVAAPSVRTRADAIYRLRTACQAATQGSPNRTDLG